MKILFLYVNELGDLGIPIGLSYLIAMLKRQKHEIFLFETTFSTFDHSEFNISGKIGDDGWKIIRDFQKRVAKINPDLIAVSCASLCLNFAIKMLESLQERPTTIFGGVGPTVDYLNLMKNEIIDYACVGFGEECLPMLVDKLDGEVDLNSIPNLIYQSNGKMKANRFSQEINLENLPLPDWSLFSDGHLKRIFKHRIKRWGNFQLTRGCPFDCAYCVNDFYHKELGIKIQKFPFEKIIGEMEVLSRQYNLEIIRIFDECFGFGNLDYYRKFAKLYRRKMDLPTIVETRPEAITLELVEILGAMNCISVSIGIEVGNENQRREMLNRNVSNHRIKKAFELLHKAGIRTSSYNMLGFPHDTKELIFETIELNRECKPDFINTSIFCPEPQTRLRKYCEKHGLLETGAIVDYAQRSVVINEKLDKADLWKIFRSFENYARQPMRKRQDFEK